MMQNRQLATLGTISFGLAVGIVGAVATVILGISAAFLDWGVLVVQVLSSLFVGYGPTFIGVAAGAVWAFFNGFVIGVAVAWVYNRLLLRRRGGGVD